MTRNVRRLRLLVHRRADRATLWRNDPSPVALVVVDNLTRTALTSLVAPIAHLAEVPLAVLTPADVTSHLPPGTWSPSPWRAGDALPASGVLLAAGEIGLGAHAIPAARDLGGHTVVVQHGILTPETPRLPSACTALTWSEADSAFWRSGRDDVATEVVGSQLLWEASRSRVAWIDHRRGDTRPVYLGQLHGSELPRRRMARAAEDFCRTRGATYRPHPAERDRRSRAQHARWERTGIEIDRSGTPLLTLGRPVAGVYSTGLLEARAAGLPVEVAYPDPPRWLTELWHRYGLEARTTPSGPEIGGAAVEPAAIVAERLTSLLRHNGLL